MLSKIKKYRRGDIFELYLIVQDSVLVNAVIDKFHCIYIKGYQGSAKGIIQITNYIYHLKEKEKKLGNGFNAVLRQTNC